MDAEQAWDSVRAWVAAWNARDLDAIMDHSADDVRFSSPTVVTRWNQPDGVLLGRARLRAHSEIGLRVPGLHFDLLDVLSGMGGHTILYRRETGALVADVVQTDEHGRGLDVRAFYRGTT